MDKLLTMERALEVQSDQLRQWKKVLTKHAYQLLCEYCERRNQDAVRPSQVPRGVDLTSFIENLKND